MLERVSTAILALDGEGGTATFADYAQWEAARSAGGTTARAAGDGRQAPARSGGGTTARGAARTAVAPQAGRVPARERSGLRRLSYREQREWDGIEQAIVDAEGTLATRQREAEDPAIASDPGALQQRYAALEAARAEVDRLYERWAELGARQEA
jgi:ATP-binding cassette subfamily F protein uup